MTGLTTSVFEKERLFVPMICYYSTRVVWKHGYRLDEDVRPTYSALHVTYH
jgi:hypothetical protein